MSMYCCPVCSNVRGKTFFSLADMPLFIGVLWADRKSARSCKTGNIDLAFCPDCGLIWNTSFVPEDMEYGQSYDNSLHFSKTFQNYTQEVVDRLTDTYDLHGKALVDIGGGSGDFLEMMCAAGGNYGYGFDPSYGDGVIEAHPDDRIQWTADYYDERHAQIQADLISSRFVFEHIPNPREFLKMIRQNIQDPERTVVYFEVPNVDLIVRQLSVWDIIYEHCTYFSVESLSRCFTECGFELLHVEESYEKQFLSVEARVAAKPGLYPRSTQGDLSGLTADVDAFSQTISGRMSEWRTKLDDWKRKGVRAVAWGAGAKAVGFLNMLGVRDEIEDVVDINPRKRGRHLAGTGQRVIAPEDLRQNPPDAVIVMNPIYRDEIQSQLAGMGIKAELFEV